MAIAVNKPEKGKKVIELDTLSEAKPSAPSKIVDELEGFMTRPSSQLMTITVSPTSPQVYKRSWVGAPKEPSTRQATVVSKSKKRKNFIGLGTMSIATTSASFMTDDVQLYESNS